MQVSKPSDQPLSQVKVVIAGGFGAGKTTLIGTTSEIEPISTDEQLTTAAIGTDKIDGVESRVKVRLRTYGFGFGPHAPWFLELKRKQNSAISKLRIRLEPGSIDPSDPASWDAIEHEDAPAFLAARDHQRVADAHAARRFRALPADIDLAGLDGVPGQRARLVEARRPQPEVEADGRSGLGLHRHRK